MHGVYTRSSKADAGDDAVAFVVRCGRCVFMCVYVFDFGYAMLWLCAVHINSETRGRVVCVYGEVVKTARVMRQRFSGCCEVVGAVAAVATSFNHRKLMRLKFQLSVLTIHQSCPRMERRHRAILFNMHQVNADVHATHSRANAAAPHKLINLIQMCAQTNK